MYSFSYLEPVCCSMSSSNCFFLTCIPVSQEAGQVVWYSHLFQSFPQFIVIHTVKGFGIVNKAGIDVFLELSCFFNDLEKAGKITRPFRYDLNHWHRYYFISIYFWHFNVFSKRNRQKPEYSVTHLHLNISLCRYFLPVFNYDFTSY